jgi:hypothetical protein
MDRVNGLTFESSYDFVTQTTKITFYIPDRELMTSGSEPAHKMERFQYLIENLISLIRAQEAGSIHLGKRKFF